MDAKHTQGEPRLLISRQALLHNVRLIRSILNPATKICAIIKADAYGHGAAMVADALCNFTGEAQEAPAVDALAVASIDEAAALPAVPVPVIIFRPVENVYLGRQRSRLEEAIRQGWVLTVCSAMAAQDLARIALAMNKRAAVQVMVDTGMSRSGVLIPMLDHLMETIAKRPSLRLASMGTHFASSEDPDPTFTQTQLRRFLDATAPHTQGPRAAMRHAANSGAIFAMPWSHLDMVRPGIALYGIDPTCRPNADRVLRPVMKWTAPLMGVRNIPAGVAVGYGLTWRAARQSRVGLLPVGYADGYLRSLSNQGIMIAGGRPVPVIGRVSMDMVTIDLTDTPHVNVGDEITVLDNDPLSPASVYELARLADTIPYEIFCRIGTRIHHIGVEPEDAPVTAEEDLLHNDHPLRE